MSANPTHSTIVGAFHNGPIVALCGGHYCLAGVHAFKAPDMKDCFRDIRPCDCQKPKTPAPSAGRG